MWPGCPPGCQHPPLPGTPGPRPYPHPPVQRKQGVRFSQRRVGRPGEGGWASGGAKRGPWDLLPGGHGPGDRRPPRGAGGPEPAGQTSSRASRMRPRTRCSRRREPEQGTAPHTQVISQSGLRTAHPRPLQHQVSWPRGSGMLRALAWPGGGTVLAEEGPQHLAVEAQKGQGCRRWAAGQ